MSKPVDWTVGIPASTLIAVGTQVSGRFPLDGASTQNLLYRMDGKNITSYIVYDDSGRAIKRVDLTGKTQQETFTCKLRKQLGQLDWMKYPRNYVHQTNILECR
ncbi:MAG: hypothetical protein EAZ79_10455 [Oscillatoriales cyanobacterium]|nr:MAG: hypothetical protein EAZ79_10455 [Oscillatoriales cyanobacterium]